MARQLNLRRAGRLPGLAALLLLLSLLAGCSGMLPSGIDDLLRVPSLNAKQAEVSRALEASVNLEDIVYRYPLRGSTNTSPILFQDLDGDGVEEAMVFYAYAARTAEVRVKILRRDKEGEWSSFHDFPGQGEQIEYVEFAYLTSQEVPSVILGWYTSSRQRRVMDIYSMHDGVFEREVSHNYDAYTIVEVGGGLSRLVVAGREEGSPFELRLFGNSGGHINKLAVIWLYDEVEEILQIAETRLWDGSRAILLDERHEGVGGTVATEIVRFTSNSFELVAGGASGRDSAEMEYYMKSYRPDPLLSVDIDKDGILEIPDTEPLPGIEEGDEVTPIQVTVYRKPTAEGLVEARRAVVNQAAGYAVFFPERWLGNVTVVDYPEASQRSFHILDERTQLPGPELLRIAVYSSRDYEETPVGYDLLGERGIMRYYGYMPPLEEEPLALTPGELGELFLLL